MGQLRDDSGIVEGESSQIRSGEWCQRIAKAFKSAQELDLKESTVCGWVTTYQKRLYSLRKNGKPLTVSRGRPLLSGSELEE